ncbi:uncharacterized protein LOC112520713 isoform X2 [Cynara cardunculus var. scolymus]|nr:uncharacterized protein LOC112520713 isoform X2 [Cynara cardunculus var. scolymus]
MENVLDENGVNDEEKEGEYKVTDLVWAKVKSYPWWPGQIFDPSASTDKARKYSKKKGFLIAYFGDQTFAWNEASKIKPFRKNFCKMEKQSNTKSFCHAVDCALDEASRRIEFGLACSCLSEEAYGKIKSQVFVNAGIRKEASRIDGGDNFSTVATFKPANVVQSVQDLAREHFDGINRLERLSVRAQLLAFYRWKGYHQFTTHHLLDGSDNEIEDNSEPPLVDKDKMVEDAKPASVGEKVSSRKRKSNASDSVSRKHQHVRNDDTILSKKGRCLSVTNGENKKKNDGGKRTTVEDNGIKEENRKGVIDRKPSNSSPRGLFRVGDSICRIAKQLSESPSILKKESQTSKVPLVCPPTDEILPQVCVAAKNPMEENQILNASAEFSSDSKNYVPEENSQLEEKNDEKRVDQIEENIHGSEVTEASSHKDTGDSCSADRIVPSVPDEQVFSEPKSVTIDTNPKTSKENSATALILKFTNLDSIPSVTNLNEIFSRYGPVRETETEVMKKNNCAKVVFEAQSNAETAFSSAGKFSIFGPSLVSYRLDYSPTLRKATATGRRQNSKDGKSVEASSFEE